MLLWFLAIGAARACAEVAAHPSVLQGLSPSYAAAFIADHPYIAFIAMGAVVLAITGAEALYADMGHFGRPPIRLAWFVIVFPALTLNYLGKGRSSCATRGRARTRSSCSCRTGPRSRWSSWRRWRP